MEPTLASLERQLDAVVTKGMRLEAVLAKVLVREAVTATILRHGGQVSPILMSHVASAVRAYEVDAATPLFVVIDQDAGRERPGITIDDLVYECRLSRDFSAHFKSTAGGGQKSVCRTTLGILDHHSMSRSKPACCGRIQVSQRA